MPELPEVETVKLGLLPVLEGHRLTHVETRRGDLRAPFPNNFANRLTGRRVIRLWRRAKYLLAELDDGQTLVIHLGMSGRMRVYASGGSRRLGNYLHDAALALAGNDQHDHVVFETDAPARIVFNDQRRFGLMLLVQTARLAEHKLFKKLGIEPLTRNFDAGFLRSALKSKKSPIKSVLLDQHVVAGLGNIYVCEALYRARISPTRSASTISAKLTPRLVRAIKDVLRAAVKAGGSSLRDHRRTDGALGMFQHRFAVYGREGERCLNDSCKGTIRRIVQAGRSTFYCPRCQK